MLCRRLPDATDGDGVGPFGSPPPVRAGEINGGKKNPSADGWRRDQLLERRWIKRADHKVPEYDVKRHQITKLYINSEVTARKTGRKSHPGFGLVLQKIEKILLWWSLQRPLRGADAARTGKICPCGSVPGLEENVHSSRVTMTPHGLHAPSSVTSQQLDNRKHPKPAASALLYITGGYIRAASCILYGYHKLSHILCHAMGERRSYATLRWHWCTHTYTHARTHAYPPFWTNTSVP